MVLARMRPARETPDPPRGPPGLLRVVSGLYFASALLVVAWAWSRLQHGPSGHWFSRSDFWPEGIEGWSLLATFFLPLFAYAASLGVLIRRADYAGVDAVSPLLLVVAVVAHPVAMFLVCAVYAHLCVFAPKGTTWESVARLSQDVWFCAVFFAPLPALVQVAHARRMKAYLGVCLLGSAWMLFLFWLLRDHYLDLIPGSTLRG